MSKRSRARRNRRQSRACGKWDAMVLWHRRHPNRIIRMLVRIWSQR